MTTLHLEWCQITRSVKDSEFTSERLYGINFGINGINGINFYDAYKLNECRI